MALVEGPGSGPNPEKNVAGGILAGASAALPIVGPLIQGALDAKTARENTDRTIAANMELAKYGYSQELEQWNRANAYNTPESQMARLKAAGLNPNLVYGNGSATGNTTPASSPRYSAPTVQYQYRNPLNVVSMLSMYQDMALKNAQIDNVKAQTDAVNQRTINDTVREDILGFERERGPELQSIFNTKARRDLNEYEGRVRPGLAYQLESLKESARRGSLENDLAMQRLQLGSKGLVGADLENERKRTEVIFNQFRNDWMRMGVTTSDHPIVRMISRLMSESGFNPMSVPARINPKFHK